MRTSTMLGKHSEQRRAEQNQVLNRPVMHSPASQQPSIRLSAARAGVPDVVDWSPQPP